MPDAIPLLKTREEIGRGFVEMVVWQVPTPVEPCLHSFKYRLVYIVNGARVIGYDNERGKGDHRHFGDREVAYRFMGVEQLVADFMADVENAE